MEFHTDFTALSMHYYGLTIVTTEASSENELPLKHPPSSWLDKSISQVLHLLEAIFSLLSRKACSCISIHDTYFICSRNTWHHLILDESWMWLDVQKLKTTSILTWNCFEGIVMVKLYQQTPCIQIKCWP